MHCIKLQRVLFFSGTRSILGYTLTLFFTRVLAYPSVCLVDKRGDAKTQPTFEAKQTSEAHHTPLVIRHTSFRIHTKCAISFSLVRIDHGHVELCCVFEQPYTVSEVLIRNVSPRCSAARAASCCERRLKESNGEITTSDQIGPKNRHTRDIASPPNLPNQRPPTRRTRFLMSHDLHRLFADLPISFVHGYTCCDEDGQN